MLTNRPAVSRRSLAAMLVLSVLSNATIAQVTNEVSVYVRPGTDVYMYESMTNASSGTFTVGSDGMLYVDGTLVNNGSMTFENAASLLRGSTGNDGTGSGTYYVKRQGSSGSVYNYWSSPMQVYTNPPGNPSYLYDSNNGTLDTGDDQPADPGWTAYNGGMTPGQGYAGMGAGLFTFVGDVNNGNINFPLTYYPYIPGNTAPGTPFNLCGNPYPSAISCADLVAANPDINGSIYFWDDDFSGGTGYSYTDYAVWNGTGSLGTGGGSVGAPNGYIAAGQGFKIRALNSGAVLNMTNSMRVAHNNAQFFRSNADASRLWFSVGGNGEYNQILIGLLEDATDSEDRLYDAIKFHGNNNISLSAMNENREYAIMAFPPPLEEKSIPLTLFVANSGVYTFKANTMENFDGMDVYFVDARTSLSVHLDEGTEIPINLAEGLYENRFYLNFNAVSTVGINDQEEDNMFIYASQDILHLITNDPTRENLGLEIFDMGGRLVFQESSLGLNNGNATVSLSGIVDGIYVVRVLTDHGFVNQRILKQ